MKPGKLVKKFTKVTAILITVSMFSGSVVAGAAEKGDNGKLDQNLQEVMQVSDEDAVIPVWIWLRSVSDKAIDQIMLDEKGMDPKEYSVDSSKKNEEIDHYIRVRREVVKRENSAVNSKFIEEHLTKGEKILYNSQYTTTLIVEASKSDIQRYEKLDIVTSISYYNEKTEVPDESNTRPVLESEAADILRQDYLQMLKEENPNNTYMQEMRLSDIVILQYCGTYDGSEVVLMSAKGWMDTTDIKEVPIGKYIFVFASGSQAERFYLHKDHKFIPVTEAYENKLLSDEDLASVVKLFSDNYAYEKQMGYEDVKETDWFYPYVRELWRKGIMTGIDDKTFAPFVPLVRAQIMVLLHRMEGEPEVTGAYPFADGSQSWYKKAVIWAANEGIVTGYTGTKNFGPNDPITRAQLATMLYRYAGYKGYDVSAKADYADFEDSDTVQEFAEKSMSWAVGAGIIRGKDDNKNGVMELDPQGDSSRAECAIMIQRFIDLYTK